MLKKGLCLMFTIAIFCAALSPSASAASGAGTTIPMEDYDGTEYELEVEDTGESVITTRVEGETTTTIEVVYETGQTITTVYENGIMISQTFDTNESVRTANRSSMLAPVVWQQFFWSLQARLYMWLAAI